MVCDLKWGEPGLTTPVASELEPQKLRCLGRRKEVGGGLSSPPRNFKHLEAPLPIEPSLGLSFKFKFKCSSGACPQAQIHQWKGLLSLEGQGV